MNAKIPAELVLVKMGDAGSQVLRKKTEPVKVVNSQIKKLVKNMFETMKIEGGVGLAAPQVGVSLRLIVISVPETEEKRFKLALINPEIVKRSENIQLLYERCLSVPGKEGLVPRHLEVEVKGTNEKGKNIHLKASDLLAHVLQHEIDHLDGILYIDKAIQVAEMGTLSLAPEETDATCKSLSKEHTCEDGIGL